MSFVSLDRLVKGGHVDEADAPRVEQLWAEIRRLKREGTQKPEWTKSLTVPAIILALMTMILSMVVIGSHLWHGIASGFQSLGADHPRITPKLLVAGKVIAVLIAAGFIAIAAWVYLTQTGRVRA